jgi:glycosyltransferase involved in cell wall biosynthesis
MKNLIRKLLYRTKMAFTSPSLFLEKVRRRLRTRLRRGTVSELARFEAQVRKARTVVVIFSTTKLLENEGQRPTQIALELARRRIPAVFLYWRWRSTDWCPQDRLAEGIFQLPIDVVTDNPDEIFGRFRKQERIALFGFPHPSFFESLATANAAGWLTVYDVHDDWEEFHRVGQATWWEGVFERHFIASSDAVFAINGLLAQHIRDLGGKAVEVNPNGLRPEIARVDAPRLLERGEVTVGYFGYLAGAWFDWELVAAAAMAKPTWRFYLIGYGGEPQGFRLPRNVVLLGKKPYRELASYAANWDVAIIPFKPDRLAAGADPIKTYEYLALGLPVVATGVFAPPGSESYVRRAEGLEAFLNASESAARQSRPEDIEARKAYAAEQTWAQRVDSLLASLRQGRQQVSLKKSLIGGAV